MTCQGTCKKLIGGTGCRCKELWEQQRLLFLEHFRREAQHNRGMCDCQGICIYPNKDKYTTEAERKRMLDAYTEQEYYNYMARYEERINDMKAKASLLVKSKRETRYWIRATFPKDQELEDIDGLMNRIVRLKPFKGIICNVEFWSDNGQNFNPHSHMLVPKNCKKSKIIKDLARLLKVKENMIEIKEINKEIDLKIKYINGDKQESKKCNVELDRETRKKFNIKEVYNAI